MPPRTVTFSPDLIEKARVAHMEGASQREVADILGVSAPTAGKRISLWGWPDVRARYERCYIRIPKEIETGSSHVPDTQECAPVMDLRGMVGGQSAAAREPEPVPVPHLADGQIGEKLRELLIREMMKVEAGAVPPPLAARTLASLAQTFRVLTKLPAAPPEEEEIDVEAFRLDVTRRLEALLDDCAAEATMSAASQNATTMFVPTPRS